MKNYIDPHWIHKLKLWAYKIQLQNEERITKHLESIYYKEIKHKVKPITVYFN